MSRRFLFPHLVTARVLGGSAHFVELRHQAGLSSRGVVLVDNVLARDPIEHAQRVADSKRRRRLIAVFDRNFCLLNVRAGSRNIRPVPQTTSLRDTNALLSGFGIGQFERPLANRREMVMRTAIIGISAASERWYQTERKSTTEAQARGERA